MEVMHGHQHLKVFRQSDEVAQLLKSQPEIQELMSGPDGDGHFDHWFNQTGGRSKPYGGHAAVPEQAEEPRLPKTHRCGR